MAADVVGRRYRLEERLSKTAMAEVWVANDPVLERRVVVKLLAADADRPRFEREAHAAAALAHPNIVQLFDYGESGGRPYMVFEHLPGGTLADLLPEGGALPDEDTRRIAADIAGGLAHAHLHGVVHRDLKPGNVLFDAEGRAKVADFGIAHVQGTDTLTDSGIVLGTAAYISPEQVTGDRVTPASDVYAFGVVLYRMLTGRFPFESANALELARMHRDDEPPPLRSVRGDAPADLAALAMAALAKDPSARPADGAALLEALEPSGPTTTVAEAATMRLPAMRWRRTRLAYVLTGTALLAAGIVAAVIIVGSHSSGPAVPGRAHVPTQRHRTQSSPTTSVSTTSTTTSPTTTRGTTTGTVPPPPPPPTTVTTAPSTTAPTTTAPTTTGP